MFSNTKASMFRNLQNTISSLKKEFSLLSSTIILISSALLAFGLYNIHSFSDVTEGGVLGLTLLLEHRFDISPSFSGFLLNFICYAIGLRLLGKSFLLYSFIASAGFSVSYRIFEQFDPVFPSLAEMPLFASVLGALFVGVSVGFSVRYGGAPSGDDALAMSISKITSLKIQWVYFICDLVVLVLSLSYIPMNRIGYSILTVILSGQIIGLIQRIQFPWL